MKVDSDVSWIVTTFVQIVYTLVNMLQKGHCDSGVEIRYSSYHSEVMGTYNYLNKTYNDRPMFRHSCKPLYLFFMNHKLDFWIVGPTVGKMGGYLLSRDSATSPHLVRSEWRVYDDSSKTWKKDPSLAVFEAGAKCDDTFKLSSDHIPVSWQGEFSRHGYFNDEMFYKHSFKNLYIYHHSVGGCKKWVLGSTVGSDNIHMFTQKDMTSPTTGMTSWVVLNDVSDHVPVSITCVGQHDETCLNGQEWNQCGSPCTRTCQDRNPVCIEICEPKCQCPDDTPIWHEGECIEEEECPPLGTGTPVNLRACGERKVNNVEAAIFNGEDSYRGKWPFSVGVLRSDGKVVCGGVLLTEKFVLTAGHCIDSGANSVLLGAFDLDSPEATAVEYQILNTFKPDTFDWVTSPFRLLDDVGILELDGTVVYNDYVQPACIPEQDEDIYSAYDDCYMMGWGKETEVDDAGGKLQEAPVLERLNPSDCKDTWYTQYGFLATSNAFCAFADRQDRVKICKGDSGSPLMCSKEGRWFALGTVSWAVILCDEYIIPSVYADVSKFTNWMESITGQL